MASKIIELRQADADKVNSNGDYNINLRYTNELVVEDGDQIMIKNIFVDTLAQSNQQINVPSTLSIELDFVYYYIYSRTDYVKNTGGVNAPPAIDGLPYIVCYDSRTGGGNPNMEIVTHLTIHGNYTDPQDSENVTINYTDSSGTKQQTSVFCKFGGDRTVNPNAEADCHISYDNTQAITYSVTLGSGLGQLTPTITTPPADITLTPFYGKLTVALGAGNYSPDQLVKEFNRQVQSAVSKGGQIVNSVYTNSCLTSHEKLKAIHGDFVYLCKSDGTQALKVDGDLIFGASFVELAFVESTQQYAWEYLHQPYYIDAVPPNPALSATGYITMGAPNFITINKNSGISFIGSKSTYADGSNARFIDNILGFGKTMFIGIQTDQARVLDGENVTTIKTTVALEDTVNTTGGFLSLSGETNLNGTPINAGAGLNWWESIDPILKGGFNNFLSSTSDTYDILSSQTNGNKNQFRFGYYLISVESDFRSQFFGKEVKSNVMGILSRYYENNSFTSGTSDDSVVYIHTGAPINLQKFNIKIMKPDKTIADNLGAQSAVYLEIIKGQ